VPVRAVPSGSRIITTYMIMAGLYTLAPSLIWSVNTLFLLDAGLLIGSVFLANALFSAGMVLFEIPTGVVADTLGRRVSYLASVAVLAVTTLLYLAAAAAGAGIVTFAAVSVAMGLGFTFYSGALEAWLVDGLDAVGGGDRLDHVFARGNQVSGAAMFAGTIGGGFLGQLDLAVPFVARAALLVAVFAVAARLMVEVGFEPLPLVWRSVPRRMRAQAAVGVAFGWRHRGLRLLMISGGVRGVFFGWAFYAAQPYFLALLRRDAVWVVGLVTAGVSLATIAGNQVVEVLARGCGRRSTLLLGAAAVGTTGAVVVGLTSTFWVAVAGLLLVAGAMGVTMPVRQTYLHRVTAGAARPACLGSAASTPTRSRPWSRPEASAEAAPLRHEVQTDRHPVEAVAGRRVALEDPGVVARHHEGRVGGQPVAAAVPGQHGPHIVDDGEGTAGLHVLVVVAGVRGQHQPPGLGGHPHHLQAQGVTSDVVHREALGQLVVAVVERHPALVDEVDQVGHVVGGETVVQCPVGHPPPGGIGHLGVLEVEPGPGELGEAADVVVVEVGQDDVVDGGGIDPDRGQPLGHRSHQCPPPALGVVGVEAGVDDPDPVVRTADDRPDEVVHVHRLVVRVAADEVVGPAGRSLGVLDGVDAVGRGLQLGLHAGGHYPRWS
jgi:MFS family permease